MERRPVPGPGPTSFCAREDRRRGSRVARSERRLNGAFRTGCGIKRACRSVRITRRRGGVRAPYGPVPLRRRRTMITRERSRRSRSRSSNSPTSRVSPSTPSAPPEDGVLPHSTAPMPPPANAQRLWWYLGPAPPSASSEAAPCSGVSSMCPASDWNRCSVHGGAGRSTMTGTSNSPRCASATAPSNSRDHSGRPRSGGASRSRSGSGRMAATGASSSSRHSGRPARTGATSAPVTTRSTASSPPCVHSFDRPGSARRIADDPRREDQRHRSHPMEQRRSDAAIVIATLGFGRTTSCVHQGRPARSRRVLILRLDGADHTEWASDRLLPELAARTPTRR